MNAVAAFSVLLGLVALPVWAAPDCTTRPIRIQGGSMAPRFADGATVQVEIGRDCTFVPVRGMALLFINHQSPIPLVKTVVAQPGDRWDVGGDGRVIVNGAEAVAVSGRPYRLAGAGVRMLQLYVRDYGGVIPPETYLLLGAYEQGSLDAARFGLVQRGDVIGRVLE